MSNKKIDLDEFNSYIQMYSSVSALIDSVNEELKSQDTKDLRRKLNLNPQIEDPSLKRQFSLLTHILTLTEMQNFAVNQMSKIMKEFGFKPKSLQDLNIPCDMKQMLGIWQALETGISPKEKELNETDTDNASPISIEEIMEDTLERQAKIGSWQIKKEKSPELDTFKDPEICSDTKEFMSTFNS